MGLPYPLEAGSSCTSREVVNAAGGLGPRPKWWVGCSGGARSGRRPALGLTGGVERWPTRGQSTG